MSSVVHSTPNGISEDESRFQDSMQMSNEEAAEELREQEVGLYALQEDVKPTKISGPSSRGRSHHRRARTEELRPPKIVFPFDVGSDQQWKSKRGRTTITPQTWSGNAYLSVRGVRTWQYHAHCPAHYVLVPTAIASSRQRLHFRRERFKAEPGRSRLRSKDL